MANLVTFNDEGEIWLLLINVFLLRANQWGLK